MSEVRTQPPFDVRGFAVVPELGTDAYAKLGALQDLLFSGQGLCRPLVLGQPRVCGGRLDDLLLLPHAVSTTSRTRMRVNPARSAAKRGDNIGWLCRSANCACICSRRLREMRALRRCGKRGAR